MRYGSRCPRCAALVAPGDMPFHTSYHRTDDEQLSEFYHRLADLENPSSTEIRVVNKDGKTTVEEDGKTTVEEVKRYADSVTTEETTEIEGTLYEDASIVLVRVNVDFNDLERRGSKPGAVAEWIREFQGRMEEVIE